MRIRCIPKTPHAQTHASVRISRRNMREHEGTLLSSATIGGVEWSCDVAMVQMRSAYLLRQGCVKIRESSLGTRGARGHQDTTGEKEKKNVPQKNAASPIHFSITASTSVVLVHCTDSSSSLCQEKRLDMFARLT